MLTSEDKTPYRRKMRLNSKKRGRSKRQTDSTASESRITGRGSASFWNTTWKGSQMASACPRLARMATQWATGKLTRAREWLGLCARKSRTIGMSATAMHSNRRKRTLSEQGIQVCERELKEINNELDNGIIERGECLKRVS